MDFYSTSARILDTLLASEEPQSLKALCANFAAKSSPPRCYALVAETLKYLPTLERLLRSVDLLTREAKVLNKKNSKSSKAMVLLLMHDLLFSKKGIALPKEHKVREAVERYAVRLRANLQREKIRQSVSYNEGLQVPIDQYIGDDLKGKKKARQNAEDNPDDLDGKIRWLRVNEIKWTPDEAVVWLESNGWTEVASLSELASGSRNFCVDDHIPTLLAFPFTSVSLPKFPPYQDARLIAQDKASCMPAHLLLQQVESEGAADEVVVIDATSAPGNKTSYASATLTKLGGGQVYAFERDQGRYGTLRKMLSRAGSRNVKSINADFLQVVPTEEPYSEATHILVDPSCSGSGIHSDWDDESKDPAELEARLKALSAFQQLILSHALRFPNARRVVYSTCSVHTEENEQVVFSTLAKPEFAGTWQVEKREKALPDWPLRGLDMGEEEHKEQAEGLIRCDRSLGTHGFFVAVLVREGRQNEATIAKEKTESSEAPLQDSHNYLDDTDDDEADQMEAAKEERRRQALQKVLSHPQFGLLRLATLDRKRRHRLAALQAAQHTTE